MTGHFVECHAKHTNGGAQELLVHAGPDAVGHTKMMGECRKNVVGTAKQPLEDVLWKA